MFGKSRSIPSKADALPGRDAHMPVPAAHFVNGNRLEPPFPEGLSRAVFALGCFWGAERKFWERPGVYTRPRWAMLPVTRRTRRIARSAAG